MTRPLLLNVGCGATVHPDWVNLDVAPALPGVLRVDLRAALPYPETVADACYSSHVLEHLERQDARRFLVEALRVLKPGAVLRVVVPDLEGIARQYLHALEDVLAGHAHREADYDWMMLELLDQSVRSRPGGDMLRFSDGAGAGSRGFVISRIGREGEHLFAEAGRGGGARLLERVRRRGFGWLAGKLKMEGAAAAAGLVGGREARLALTEGAVRRSGEVHRWMYDRFSLPRLLREVGFVEVEVGTAHDSRIPDFSRYQLDVVDGRVRKPDSLFVEGLRP